MKNIILKAALAWLLASCPPVAVAQRGNELVETVWGTVIYTTVGDSSPIIWKDRNLSPFGAQQLYDAGTAIANRYVRPSSEASRAPIQGISPYDLSNNQLKIVAKDEIPAAASAMAFMQGLYPARANENRTGPDANARFPYAGYQYPKIEVAGGNNPLLMQIAGYVGCPNYTRAMNTYSSTEEFASTLNDTQHFYRELSRHELKKAFAEDTVSYASASTIWDYLRYQWPRSPALQVSTSQAELAKARELANKFEWAVNTDVKTPHGVGKKDIKAIHGKTLARAVTKAITDNIDYKGERHKMTLLFGDHRPMMAFASLSKLASRRHPSFYTLPNGGASFIFELFSYTENATETNSTSTRSKYPVKHDLNVRFYMRNDTSSSKENFRAYPLFEGSPSKLSMPLPEFLKSMKEISVEPAEWCNICDSKKAWCAVATAGESGTSAGSCASRTGEEDEYQKTSGDEYNPWACGDKAVNEIRSSAFRLGVVVMLVPCLFGGLIICVICGKAANSFKANCIWAWNGISKCFPRNLFRRRPANGSRPQAGSRNTRQTGTEDIELQACCQRHADLMSPPSYTSTAQFSNATTLAEPPSPK